ETIAAAVADNNIEIVALGPLTNLAAAGGGEREWAARAGLRVVGGNVSSRGVLPPLWPFEFNLARDREAARHVLGLSWRELTLFPLDVVRRQTVDRARLDELARGSALGGYLAEESLRWLRRARWRHLRARFPLWDLPAALDVAGLLGFADTGVRRLAPGARWWLRERRGLRCLT